MDLKKPLSLDEQVHQLESHGMRIDDKAFARAFLSRVSYYRFSGYLLHLRASATSSDLMEGVTFDQIYRLYCFDVKLRNLLRKYIEIVELFLKTHVANIFAMEYCQCPPYTQHYDLKNYYNEDGADRTFSKFKKEENYYADSLVVKHHKAQYDGKMPLWVMFEMMTFSSVSMLYSAMWKSTQDRIANPLGIGGATLVNHLHCLSILRNKCAHASRLVNARYNPPAKLSPKLLQANPTVNNDSLFAYIFVLLHRLPNDTFRQGFKGELFRLLDEYDGDVDLALIGFPKNYKALL